MNETSQQPDISETKNTDLENNVVAVDSIGVIPEDVKAAAEKLKLNENVAFSTGDELIDYLKKRQNIFTYALEGFARNHVDTTNSVNMLKVNQGWEKKNGDEVTGSLRDDPEAMFTGRDLCTLSCITLISFLKEALKDQEDTEVHMLKVDAKKKITESEDSEETNEPFIHNILHARIGDQEVFIDPTYRQIDSEHPDPFLIMTDYSDVEKTYIQDEEGNTASYADQQIGNVKAMMELTDEKIERFKQVLYISD